MGKPIRQGRAEIEKCAWVCNHYAAQSAEYLEPTAVCTEAKRSYVAFEPLGVVLAVMPWNFPFWQVLRFAVPALAAGNAVLLKHASNVTGCALAIEDLFRDAGLPEGLFRTLLIGADRVASVIADPRVDAVTLTGSTPAGRAVARTAGEHLKKTVLELGGSDAYLLLEDADLETAVEACVESRLTNSGQSCIAAKRFIVPTRRLEEIAAMFVDRMVTRKVGSPLDDQTDVGPQARRDLRDQLHRQVEETLARGATCLTGGFVPEGPGAFYPPTVLRGVMKGMPAYDEELFGPVAALIAAKDEEDAIRIANDSSFGLGAAVFTRDTARGEAIARHRLQAGLCFVNASVHSDPRLPFGGIKHSGYGRELGMFGIREFTNIKTVVIR
jgi:succinate-semialdehyde dehydrogenase/glutarate-semialdehyde dehydrogenase